MRGVVVEFGAGTPDLLLGHSQLAEALVIRNLQCMQQAGRRVRRQFVSLANRGGRPLTEINGHTDLAIRSSGLLLDYQHRSRSTGKNILRSGADKQFIGRMFAVTSENDKIRIAGLRGFDNASDNFGDLDAGPDCCGPLRRQPIDKIVKLRIKELVRFSSTACREPGKKSQSASTDAG